MANINYTEKQRPLQKAAMRTMAAQTIYVRSTGNNTYPGTAALPVLTIQEAVNRIPDFVNHVVTIDIGAGSFAKFDLSNFTLGVGGQIVVTGTMVTATLAQGATSGTSTGGSTTTLTLASANWASNDLRGRWVSVNSNLYLIKSNDSTTLTIAGVSGSTMSGKAFTIQDNGTLITGGTVRVTSIQGPGDLGDVSVQKLKLTTSTTDGIYCAGVHATLFLKWLYAESMSSSAIRVWFCDYLVFYDNYAKNCSSGFSAGNVDYAYLTNCYAHNSTYSGCSLTNCPNASIVYSEYSSNGSNGIETTASFPVLYGVVCSSNTQNGVLLSYFSMGAIMTVTGTSNGQWGLKIIDAGRVKIDSANTVTGASGDTTVDKVTPVTWASFTNVGDIAVSTTQLQKIERTS